MGEPFSPPKLKNGLHYIIIKAQNVQFSINLKKAENPVAWVRNTEDTNKLENPWVLWSKSKWSKNTVT